jgi:urease accessory protein UreF
VQAALMLASATSILQAAMRLSRVSHRDVQAALHRLRPRIATLAADVQGGSAPLRPRAFHPVQEISAMRHARAEARLFAS